MKDLIKALAQLTGELGRARSFGDAAHSLVTWARTLTGCEAGFLRIIQQDEAGGTWMPACALQNVDRLFVRDESLLAIDECMCGRIARGDTSPDLPFFTTGRSFVWGHASILPVHFSAELGAVRGRCIEEGYESIGIFPLLAGDDPVGILHVADRRRDRLCPSLVQVLEAGCRLAGGILLGHQELERERAALAAIETALLPPHPPSVAGLDIGLSYSSASHMSRIGGDFYDVLALGSQEQLILVGDHSGKGIRAAGMAARARYAIASLARQTGGPGRLLQDANQTLAEILPGISYVSAVACIVAPQTGHARIAAAGHPPPLLRRAMHGVSPRIEELGLAGSPPLGVLPGSRYDEFEFTLEREDILLLYTDGVVDSRRNGSFFGIEGISKVLSATDTGDLNSLAEAIRSASERFHSTTLPPDDRLVIAVRRAQPSA